MPTRPRHYAQTTWYASASLCRQLADLIGWQSFTGHYWEPNGFVISHDQVSEKRLRHWQLSGKEAEWDLIPAFELGWLVRQLPEQLDGRPLRLIFDGSQWNAGYDGGPQVSADTPEDAVCQLAIELVERRGAGEDVVSS